MNSCVFVLPKVDGVHPRAQEIRRSAQRDFNINVGSVKTGKILEFIDKQLNDEERQFISSYLVDCVVDSTIFYPSYNEAEFLSYVVVSKKHGITDDESRCAEKTYEDRFSCHPPSIKIHQLYMFENKLEEKDLQELTSSLMGNPLIHDFTFAWNRISGPFISKRKESKSHAVTKIDISNLSLSEEEILCIKNYFSQSSVQDFRKFRNLNEITDCEWEIIGQTWSEHCKHKEFNAEIFYKDLDTGETKQIDSLFKSKIKKATEEIDTIFKSHHPNNKSFLVKVFNDNAGVVKVDDENLFVWKVETHNTPSALDPYGGAMTGVLGVNRDAMGTGVGGARLLFNTNVLCFGPPSYSKPLIKGQKHPLYIKEGVVAGIRDAGNQSGVPTINGSVHYDERYSGKPLVFCGTGALLPKHYGSSESWGKNVESGDHILMVGGRVGKDGIHGATASSTHADEHTPSTIVQIGSPLTQKLLSDFLEAATRKGLVKSSTDNGAGGLSSSIGELAELAGGARVYLEKVPLKYPGLQPWEIFVSESQERMTLVCDAKHIETLKTLSQSFEVEISDIGEFTNTGLLEVFNNNETVACLDLDFLHNGAPKRTLFAEWKKPDLHEPQISCFESYNQIVLDLLSSDNICSRKSIIRQYDHEVKGRSIIKPLMGKDQNAPQDAAVLRLDFETYGGLAVSNGIIPRYGDIDAYEMSAGSFDEAVRQIIAVGGQLPDPKDEEPIFWSVNDNFCVPNIVYDPESNPEGKLKLAKLVQMCEALYDMSTYFLIPMTSGKDSMKNDFGKGRDKISVPPTILYSMVAGIDDIRKTLSSEWKNPGDLIYQVGFTYDELGASEFYKLLGFLGANVPKVRKEQAKATYQKFSQAHKESCFKSAHDLSDGGLIISLAESCIGSGLGANVKIKGNPQVFLFSESHSRFVVSISQEKQSEFESIMGSHAQFIGEVSEDPFLHCYTETKTYLHCSVTQMKKSWERELI